MGMNEKFCLPLKLWGRLVVIDICDDDPLGADLLAVELRDSVLGVLNRRHAEASGQVTIGLHQHRHVQHLATIKNININIIVHIVFS